MEEYRKIESHLQEVYIYKNECMRLMWNENNQKYYLEYMDNRGPCYFVSCLELDETETFEWKEFYEHHESFEYHFYGIPIIKKIPHS